VSQMHCIVVTPDEVVLEEPVEFVVLTLYDGEIGIAPGRTPLIGRLGSGEMRIYHEGKVSYFYIDGGFVEVLDETVTVLTHQAIPGEKLDAFVLQTKLDGALSRPAATLEQRALRDAAVAEYRAKLRVAHRTEFSPEDSDEIDDSGSDS